MRGPRILVASNRGPVTFVREDDDLVPRRGAGGLVTALTAVVQETGGLWVASAMSEGDRMRLGTAPNGLVDLVDGDAELRVRLLEFDADTYDRAYNEISNRLLWFLHHYLWDLPRAPVWTSETWEAWTAYREVNHLFASALAEELHGEDAEVLIQDYHLSLAPSQLRALAPEARIAHFHHSPFAGAEYMRLLPMGVRRELLEGLLGADVLGFQTERWAESFLASCALVEGTVVDLDRREVGWGSRTVRIRHYPIAIDADALRAAGSEQAVDQRRTELEQEVGGRKLLLRVDRAELSKNVLRGFAAFGELLRRHPEWRERVVFLALLNPSRSDLPEYRTYTDECFAAAQRINEELETPEWTPIQIRIEDDFDEVLAAFRIYDALLVNPLYDGMNLVAKEGPVLNERGGALILSRNAGSFAELAAHAIAVDPLDVAATADAIREALEMPSEIRATRAKALRDAATAVTPARWVGRQLEDLASG